MYYAHALLTDRGLQAKMHGGAVDTAYAWERRNPGLRKEIDRLRPAKIVIDYEKTNDDARPCARGIRWDSDVKLEGSYWWSFGSRPT